MRLRATLSALSALAGISLAACGGGSASLPGGAAHVPPGERERASVQAQQLPESPHPAQAAEPSLFSFPAPISRGLAPPSVTAGAVVVMDEASGAVLFAHNPDVRLATASLTKVATAVVVLEHGPLADVVTVQPDVDRYWLNDSTAMGLQPGDALTIRDLLYGMLLVSGNDAADALALATAGTTDGFVAEMNALASRIGLRDTHFDDVHGLGGPDHYSSARDLAILSRYAMTFPDFREIVGTEEHVVRVGRDLPLYNLNPLLNYTPGVDGIKTGFTETAGKTISLSATRDSHRVYVIMLDAPFRAQDAIALVEWAFANHDWGASHATRE